MSLSESENRDDDEDLVIETANNNQILGHNLSNAFRVEPGPLSADPEVSEDNAKESDTILKDKADTNGNSPVIEEEHIGKYVFWPKLFSIILA